ncbi:hypothetical protein WN48_00319 [Eufriesea mexicana]|uniref:Uncharacterized protein n=1 Tax=Eufriesea mexicana TaxID=516756 RepID=A0A310SBY3_9HYME|nr:hypothetical protein WN48_00319 [Eufriesea mexicana]
MKAVCKTDTPMRGMQIRDIDMGSVVQRSNISRHLALRSHNICSSLTCSDKMFDFFDDNRTELDKIRSCPSVYSEVA